MSLRDKLQNWTDWDRAAFLLAISLGILEEDAVFANSKSLLWISNPVGEMLDEMLNDLAAADILDRREDQDTQYRWSSGKTY